VPMMARTDLSVHAVLEELRTRRLSTSAIDDRRRAVARDAAARRQALDDQARRAWNSTPIAIERLSTELNRLIDPGAIVVTELIS